MHEDAGRMNLVGIEFARIHEMLNFRNRDFAAGRGVRIEVASCAPIDQIAVRIGFPRLHQREIGYDPALEDVGLAVELFVFLTFGDDRADPRARVEARDPRLLHAHRNRHHHRRR